MNEIPSVKGHTHLGQLQRKVGNNVIITIVTFESTFLVAGGVF